MTSDSALAISLLELRIRTPRPLGPDGRISGIDKCRVTGPFKLTAGGLVGDRQADRRHQGGPEKAVHHYPAEHYAFWRAQIPHRSCRFLPGGLERTVVPVLRRPPAWPPGARGPFRAPLYLDHAPAIFGRKLGRRAAGRLNLPWCRNGLRPCLPPSAGEDGRP